jgi:hypothetical protein
VPTIGQVPVHPDRPRWRGRASLRWHPLAIPAALERRDAVPGLLEGLLEGTNGRDTELRGNVPPAG